MVIGGNQDKLKLSSKNVPTTYTTRDIHERTGRSLDQIKRTTKSILRGVAGLPYQKGITRHLTPNQTFLVVLAHHLTLVLRFSIKEAQDIMTDLFHFLQKENLLPESTQRKFDYYDVENGKIRAGVDDEGNDTLIEVHDPDYFPMDIHIMRVMRDNEPVGFQYKKYQLKLKKPVEKDGFKYFYTESIEGDVEGIKPTDGVCDDKTIYILPITDILSRFRVDFNCPLTFPSVPQGETTQPF